MSPFQKVCLGVVLVAPFFLGSLYFWLFGLDNPALTDRQVSNVALPYLLPALLPALAGIVMIHHGMEEYDDE